MADDEKVIAARLREAREFLGLSQAEVAGALDVPRTSVSALECGYRRVTGLELRRLARLYRRPVAWLLGEDAELDEELLDLMGTQYLSADYRGDASDRGGEPDLAALVLLGESLRATAEGLDRFIERRAAELAKPAIEEAERSAARFEERAADLREEFGRMVRHLESQLASARRRLDAAKAESRQNGEIAAAAIDRADALERRLREVPSDGI